ncbi:MAG: hypothetical protein AB7K24_07940 [Gemmataceae bacterium]
MLLIIFALAWGTLFTTRFWGRASFAERIGFGLLAGILAFLWLPFVFALFLGLYLGSAAALGLLVVATGFELTMNKEGCLLLRDEAAAWLAALHSGGTERWLIVSWLAFGLFAGYLCYNHYYMPGADGLYTAGTCWGDVPMHTSFAMSFLYRDNLHPPEYPCFAGYPLGYPFIPDFATASLMSLGLPLAAAYSATTWLPMMSFFLLLYAAGQRWLGAEAGWAPLLSLLLFFLAGGLGFLIFFDKLWTGSTLDYALRFNYCYIFDQQLLLGNPIGTFLAPRCSVYGMAIVLAAVLLFGGHPDQPVGAKQMWAAGILGGTLPMIHSHSFLVMGFVACWYAWLERNEWRRWLWFFLAFTAVALPQVFWIWQHVRRSTPFVFPIAGYPYPALSLAEMNYWLWNGGLLFVLLPVAWWLAPGEAQLRTFPFLILAVLANFVSFTPNPFDNLKFYYYTQMIGATLVAYLLMRWRERGLPRSVLALLIVILCSSGTLSLVYECRDRTLHMTYEEVAVCDYVKEHTSPDAILLTASPLNHPVPALTGRRVLLGQKVWLFCHGVPYEQREKDIEAIFAGDKSAAELLARYQVDLVVVGPHEREQFKELDEDALGKLAAEKVTIGGHTLYRIEQAKK